MKGYIYIAGSFDNVNRSACGQGEDWIDNDPHFWTSPPTWGICLPDLREKVAEDDVVFFVLPAQARHSQMVFGYSDSTIGPCFLGVLSRVMERTADRPIDLISRYGAELNQNQVEQLKIWLASA